MTSVAAADAAIDLTPRRVTYALTHSREAIERRIDRHLALVTALLAILDQQDGDPDLEPSLGYASIEANLGPYAPTVEPDREDNLGSTVLRLRDGTIVNDLEATDCGLGVCDDHGIADTGGLADQFGSSR